VGPVTNRYRLLWVLCALAGDFSGTFGGAGTVPGRQDPTMSGDGELVFFDSGRSFFDSADALVAGDVNALQDVYEWEDGYVYLISDGCVGLIS
jgi:hypothetical protein